MSKRWLPIFGVLASLALAPAAHGASDPLFVFTPAGSLYGPCGLAVDSSGRYHVSDYYHHAIDVFSGQSYVSQIANVDPTDGPCGLALDSTDHLYVNDYHRDVRKSPPSGTVFDANTPTGVAVDAAGNVYVNDRAYVAEYDSAGTPIQHIGEGTLQDGYGIAVSQYPGTLGDLYVPDAATNTVKVYEPATSTTTPVATIKDPFNKPFVSLRDSAVAVDRVTGDVYFADNLQPEVAERPQAEIYVYSSTNGFKGHLKYNVTDALPPGLAVDNSTLSSQGRVYVTSGNTTPASIYAYGPGSATNATPLPPINFSLGAGGNSGGEEAKGAAAAASASSPASASSVITQSENLRVTVDSHLSPKRLPRKGSAPISVSVSWRIETTDGTAPPRLKTLQIAINREGRFDTEGLPTCPHNKIQPASTQRALSNCRSALVGRGTFSAEIALKGQEAESYETKGTLLVFNGEEKGKPVLFGQIYAAHPFATSFVIPFQLATHKKGTYGTVLSATLPAALRSWGNLNGIEMRLQRRYGANGKRHSFISAGCPAPKGFGLASFKLARTAFGFTGGKKLSSTVTGDCRVRG